MMPELINVFNKESGAKVKKVTTVRAICDMRNNTSISKVMFSEMDKLLKIYLTVPVTTATAERTFSTMRRIKTYLRSTMTQERLNHAMTLHIHKGQTDELNITDIAQQFILLMKDGCTHFINTYMYITLSICSAPPISNLFLPL